MDARTITEKSKALLKATQANESPSVIIGILNELKRGVVADEDILRSTRIGVTVNKSKQHKNSEVAQLASEIVRKWRDEVERKRGGSAIGHKAGVAARARASPSGNSSPAGGKSARGTPTPSSALSNVAPDQRNHKTDKIDVAVTGSDTRDRCVGLIYDALAYMSSSATFPPATVLSVAREVEAAAHTTLGPAEKPAYKAKVRSLYQNLKNKSNGALRERVLRGDDLTADGLVNLSADDLKSQERREEDRKMQNENMRAAQAPQEEKSISQALQCSKCGMKKVSYNQAQTRSADEPMTTFCECLNCGKRWKFS